MIKYEKSKIEEEKTEIYLFSDDNGPVLPPSPYFPMGFSLSPSKGGLDYITKKDKKDDDDDDGNYDDEKYSNRSLIFD